MGGLRSARLLYHAPINNIMIGDTTHYSFKRKPIDPEVSPEVFDRIHEYTVTAYCSGEEEGYEAYRAFNQGKDPNGWLTPVGGVEASWISVNLPGWFFRPKCKNPRKKYKDNGQWVYSWVHSPAITLLEVWNPSDSSKSAKKFFFQARYNGQSEEDWVTLKICEIKDKTANKRTSFPIEYYQNDEELYESIEDLPEYDEYRILITECYGTEQVGFSRIDLCALCDHGELNWDYEQWNEESGARYRFPKHYAKFYILNDDNDGVIWERIHDTSEIILATTRWYPGHYSSTSDSTSYIFPKDKPNFYVSNNVPFRTLDNYQGQCYGRSKDFAYTYRYGNAIYTTKDGIKWTKAQYPVWKQFTSFSPQNNKGLAVGYDEHVIHLLEIGDDGIITKTREIEVGSLEFRSTTFYGNVGGVISANKWNIDGDVITARFYFYNSEGVKYRSALPIYHEYNDQGTIRRTTCNWNFKCMNGKYFVYGINLEMIYYNSVTSKLEYWYRAVVGESSDGYKTITWHNIADPIVGYSDNYFYYWDIFYFNNHYYVTECGRYPAGANVYDYGNSYGNYADVFTDPPPAKHINNIVVPMIGYSKDPLYNSVFLEFGYVDQSPGSGQYRVKSPNGNLPLPNTGLTLWFKDGKVSEPFGNIIYSTGFKDHWWSSNSRHNGGFIMVGDKNYAFNAGQMVCYDNSTYYRCSEKWRY